MKKLLVLMIFISSSLMASNDYTFICWLNAEYRKVCREYEMLLENPMPQDKAWEERLFTTTGKLMAYWKVISEVDILVSPDQRKRLGIQLSQQTNLP